MYFRNKFNKEFLYFCNRQEPKGGKVRLDDKDHIFWEFRSKNTYHQTKTVHVIPLLLYNVIESSNSEGDKNVENFMMICENKSTTEVKCYYDNKVTSGPDTVYVCNIVDTITGDLAGPEDG